MSRTGDLVRHQARWASPAGTTVPGGACHALLGIVEPMDAGIPSVTWIAQMGSSMSIPVIRIKPAVA